MTKKTEYRIIVGEVGNEQGHGVTSAHTTDAGAVRKAKKLASDYHGDGWWRVECDGSKIDAGGRSNY